MKDKNHKNHKKPEKVKNVKNHKNHKNVYEEAKDFLKGPKENETHKEDPEKLAKQLEKKDGLKKSK